MCYSNFHHSLVNNIDRVNALNEIPNNLIYYQYGLLTRETTWMNQTEYAFVISPQGNGIDCIRTWEALCFGCIPIFKKCGIEDLFIDLPVLIVNEWYEVTNELLVDTVHKFKNMTFNYEKLKLKYWTDQINQYRHMKI
uniref:Exostosin GT47 domain-containing protein n=1 Tax=viral metagenome TaxID=1070528 RepID=A0A6C0BVA5_9ZZZZ